MMSVTLEKPLNILRSKKAYDLKISGGIFDVKAVFWYVFPTPKYIPQAKNKINHELASPL